MRLLFGWGYYRRAAAAVQSAGNASRMPQCRATAPIAGRRRLRSLQLPVLGVDVVGADRGQFLEPDGEGRLPLRALLLVLEFVALQRGADVEALVLILNAAAVVEHTIGLDVVAGGGEER